jgi:diguanylate cyclase (GGDEF)-like protein/PAS domain S-box-containing protein
MRVVGDRLFRQITNVAWTAAALTTLGLGVELVHRESGVSRLTAASLIGALVAWGCLFALRLRLRAILLHNEECYATLFEKHPQPILLADEATLEIVAVNDAAMEKYGYSSEEFAALSTFDLHRPEERDGVRGALQVVTHITKDGTVFAAEMLSTTLRLRGRFVRMTVVTDITDQNEAQAQTLESRNRYRQIVTTAKEGILTVDPDTSISAVNQQAADMLGYSIDELVGHQISEFSGAEGPESARAEEAQWSDGRLTGERETTLRDRDGTIVSVLLNESPLLDKEGRYAGQLGMITDLTERKELEDELAFQATHDPLTGLPNRLLLVDRLHLALGRAEPERTGVAVVLVDIDRFKDVNTVYGHGGGDELLVEIADRLSASVREPDTVARFGGDGFVVVSEGTGLFAEELAERLRLAIGAPCSVGDAQVDITASMGVAVGQFGDLPGTLLRFADTALLQARANGRDRIEFFTEALRTASRQRLALVSDLRRALERHEFFLCFQPVVSLADESIVGAEALIRWEHPQRGTLGPLEFIGVAEETGLIDPIGQWVIEETCRRLASWQQLMPDLSISLNISARQLAAGVLGDIVGDAITASGADPSHLALEITESVLMEDVELSVARLTALRKTGVTISIDDFGTGYSSLSYLSRFPIDVLKIDQSFVAGLPEDDYDTVLVQAMLAIAEALNLSVVAEGVENGVQAKTLLGLGCTRAQGYHFYRPLTADAFKAELVRSH